MRRTAYTLSMVLGSLLILGGVATWILVSTTLAELTALQRRWLKDTAELLHTCQESVRIAYRTDLMG